MEHNIKLTLKEIIAIIKEKYLSEGTQAIYADGDWILYHSEEGDLLPETVCCITPPPDFDEETDEEILPAFAAENGMEFSILPEVVQDVVMSAVNQKKDAAYDEITEALNYYLENDTFMEF